MSDEEILQRLLDLHATKMSSEYLEACGIPADALIGAAVNLLHEIGSDQTALHHLCPDGVAMLIKLALCAGYECGIRSCAGFRKVN